MVEIIPKTRARQQVPLLQPPLGESCTISWVKLERQAVEVEEGGPEEEGQGPKAEGKAKEGTPPWGRRAKNQQRRRDLWYDESC